MRVKPPEGRLLRDPRTKRLVDPVQGVEVDDNDLTFRWLIDQGDAVPMTEEDIAAADQALADAEAAAAAGAGGDDQQRASEEHGE